MTNNAESSSEPLVTLYGIKNCDTVKKARRWLEAGDIGYQFHDVREDGLNKTLLQEWVSALGWEAVLNKRSTTWKQLSDEDKASIDEGSAISLMLEHPTLIKRPVLNQKVNQGKSAIHNGFKPATYDAIFNN